MVVLSCNSHYNVSMTKAEKNKVLISCLRGDIVKSSNGKTERLVDDLLDDYTTQALDHGSEKIRDLHAAYVTQEAPYRVYRVIVNAALR